MAPPLIELILISIMAFSDMSFPPLVLIPLYRQFVRKTSPAELLLVIFFMESVKREILVLFGQVFISSVGDERC